ncbi:ABC transporter permease [Nesterenkonia sp. NBAIMH1]|uniref:ABC transporter permease n=1 Tax=Nesterenkonia sp. NBAIMH1 TaxID=2600320 RepID=UPI0011B56483|nr:ABC transporter permease [Nesterenkonia sp. NBAIMH1]
MSTATISVMGKRTDTRSFLLTAIAAVMPVATVLLMVYFTLNTASFLTVANLLTVITQNAPLFIISMAFAMLLMAGYVDLSVGSTMAVAGVTGAIAFGPLGFLGGSLVAITVGAAVGLINGTLIGYLSISPIVVTLGMLAAGRGTAMALAPDPLFGFGEGAQAFGSGDFLGISYIAWVAIGVAAICIFIMGTTAVGKHVLAIGVNKRAAFLTGIKVKTTVFALYIGVGVAAGIAGLVLVTRLDSAPAGTLGSGFEVTVLSAVLLGGIPFTGGRGSLWRVLLGVWFIAVLRNGLTLMNVGSEMVNIVSGIVLICAAGLEALRMYLRQKL